VGVLPSTFLQGRLTGRRTQEEEEELFSSIPRKKRKRRNAEEEEEGYSGDPLPTNKTSGCCPFLCKRDGGHRKRFDPVL
jgi:hypothetical protein